MESRRTSRLS